ncbi:glutamyl-tRNA reductase [Natrinema pellirubrum DSM 15624]|uniref:Glutamyl-tRNA reductase n=1 Tax=Natrinema pellirubrum (strain DSM 15624 / CIP 106293 / JCM 10476 / NCIMB 786 / 157) TaxID=797303 RepID=L0JPI4_NATP1|nr:glutamyl-tRNA reductase [Natrinema pellirubrum]AGB32271.1 glutamyl-tRNA reductase [Natrinema pellirubrum DSM 15624]ELY74633.1 glutamyl-tRNA reductase [Natrinema pellirubrum DSM 15624]
MHAPDSVPPDARTEPEPSPVAAVPKSVRRLACYRIDHESRSTGELGAVAPDDPLAAARRIAAHDRVTEAVVLSTCNRVEAYLSTRTPADRDAGLDAAREALGDPDGARTETELAVAEHLFRVACGLESAVIGEAHVLGQLRRTFDAALEADLAGGVVTRAADAAVSVGRRCRDETDIDEGTVGYGSATCEAIADAGGVPDRLVVVGAGEMATEVASAAGHRWDCRVDAVNRSAAPQLPTEDGRYWPLEALEAALADADAIVTATGAPNPVVTLETIQGEGVDPGTPVVDLATPPDVAKPVRRSAVQVVALDAIQRRIEAAVAGRRAAVPAVEDAITDAVAAFVDRERENRAEDTLRELHRTAAAVRESELERARDRLASGADAEAVLEDFASALTGSLLGTPTERLRAAARDGDDAVIEATHQLFDLDCEGSE